MKGWLRDAVTTSEGDTGSSRTKLRFKTTICFLIVGCSKAAHLHKLAGVRTCHMVSSKHYSTIPPPMLALPLQFPVFPSD